MRQWTRLGMLGCGVVGSGLIEALRKNAQLIASRWGLHFDVTVIAVKDLGRVRPLHVPMERLTDTWKQVTRSSEVDVVVEVMGGIHPAYQAVRDAITQGKHVVTANKELMAQFGEELSELARTHGVLLAYEASTLGGIPALHTLQTYFAGHHIDSIQAIANGTSNYILSKMDDTGCTFEHALAEAQAAGYAEADASLDVEGYDARYKLQILIRLAMHTFIRQEDISREGITSIKHQDIDFVKRLGFKVKHVAQAMFDASGLLRAAVTPCLIPDGDPLFAVDGVNNALCVESDLAGRIVFTGPGAGGLPTASAIVEDLMKIALDKGSARVATGSEVPPDIVDISAPAYLLLRENVGGDIIGPRSQGYLRQVLTASVVHYVRFIDLEREGWLIVGDDLTRADCLAAMRYFDVRPLTVMPFSSLPTRYLDSLIENVSLPVSV